MGSDREGGTPFVLGLTGAIACGKSTVGDLLLELGAIERIDADRIVHQLMSAGTPTTSKIAEEFGQEIVLPDGAVNRARLGDLVFADAKVLRKLEAIVHPAVRQSIRERASSLSGQKGVIVVDAVKLLQSDLLELCNAVWVVRCSPESQLQRMTELRKMSAESAKDRLAVQPSFDSPRVTTVIENSDSLNELRERVEREWRSLQETTSAGSHPMGTTRPHCDR